MLLAEAEDLPFTARRFGSREGLDGTPTLSVEFTVVPEPGAVALFLMGLAGLASGLRRKR
jgi:hypothetical protein